MKSMLTSRTSTSTDNAAFGIYTKEQLIWLSKARAFADSIPVADIIKADSENVFRRDLFEAACQEGFGGLPFPQTYGGAGGDYVSFCLVNEEFGRRSVPIMSSLGVHILCQEPIYRFGTETQKQKYLIPSSSGKYLAAFGLTEPAAGSDTKAIETSARVAGDEYILNGTKTFITSGASADYFIVMARLSGSEITAFIVERAFPGFALGQKFELLGMRGYATCEIVFNDCRVPRENMLGEPGWGLKVALSSLAKGRVTIAAQATGWAQGALEAALTVIRQKVKEVGTAATAVVNCAIGDMEILVESARVLTYEAARRIDRGDLDVTLASMAKLQATDVAMKVATEAISLTGIRGTDPNLLLERIFRDAKAGQIYEGTNQIQRMLIARQLLE